MPQSVPLRLDTPVSEPPPKEVQESLGLGLSPGDAHYRAYVGPPQDYDLIAATTFGLMTSLGLRQHQRVLDVGCGSLRVGRLLIPYLNAGNYCGVEPNRWLVDAGITRETGRDQLRIKRPKFHFSTSTRELPADERFDMAVAQSIFSHCGADFVATWLADISARLADDGLLVATYLPSAVSTSVRGWIYPECTTHATASIAALGRSQGLSMHLLAWPHPRQQWAVFAKPRFDASRIGPWAMSPEWTAAL
jgi:SAM-dependent methyltransferase